MKVVIDRFEENLAVIEMPDGKLINIPKILVENAKEGDIVEIKVLKEETEEKREELEEMYKNLFE